MSVFTEFEVCPTCQRDFDERADGREFCSGCHFPFVVCDCHEEDVDNCACWQYQSVEYGEDY